jgi:hypothetical protein
VALVEVCSVGELVADGAPFCTYLVRVDGRIAAVRAGADAGAVLEELARLYDSDDRTCTTELASVGGAHGFRVVPLSDDLRAERAIAAAVVASNGALQPVRDRDAIDALLHGASALERAPAEPGVSLLTVEHRWLEGIVSVTESHVVIYVRTEEAHLELFRDHEHAEQFMTALADGSGVDDVDRVGMSCRAPPPGLIAALRDHVGGTWYPLPWRIAAGTRGPITDHDARLLAATALALASRGPKERVVRIGPRVITTVITYER